MRFYLFGFSFALFLSLYGSQAIAGLRCCNRGETPGPGHSCGGCDYTGPTALRCHPEDGGKLGITQIRLEWNDIVATTGNVVLDWRREDGNEFQERAINAKVSHQGWGYSGIHHADFVTYSGEYFLEIDIEGSSNLLDHTHKKNIPLLCN